MTIMVPATKVQQLVVCGFVLLLLQLTAEVAGHGLMLQPRSRNWIGYVEQNFYWAHGLNAGGVSVVSDNGKLKYPSGRRGMCGDSYKETRWDTPGQVQATYMSGQVIAVDSMIATNHLGRIDLAICDLKAKPGSKQCTSLSRADSKGKHWYIPFVSNWTGGNSGFVRPAYSDGSFSWYVMPPIRATQGCKAQRDCDAYINMVVYRTQWKLPQGFSCRQCKLQWHYLTASTCWPPCPEANKNEPTCKNIQVFPTCGSDNAQYPEEFWNCADVQVVSETSRADASKLSSSNTAAWENLVTVNSGAFGTPQAYRMGQYNRRKQMLRRRSLLSWLGFTS